MPTRDRILCPMCGINEMQRTSQRCVVCAYLAKSIAWDVKERGLALRFLAGEQLVFKLAPTQVPEFARIWVEGVT